MAVKKYLGRNYDMYLHFLFGGPRLPCSVKEKVCGFQIEINVELDIL